jgi:nucleoid-associated protein YgaU
MRFSRSAFGLLLLTSGCNYIHFGRIETGGDAGLAAANTDLRIDKKLLQQELVITRKENESLHVALEHLPAGSGNGGADELATRLSETTRELAELRTNYARLQAVRERSAPVTPAPSLSPPVAGELANATKRFRESEEKLGASEHALTALQDENRRLRLAVDQAHAENAALAEKIAQSDMADAKIRSALAELNTELLAQKEARARAEQDVGALRRQLQTISDHERADPAGRIAAAHTPRRDLGHSAASASVNSAGTLSTPAAKPEGIQRIEATPAGAERRLPRTYVVQPGDTLKTIAERIYGRNRWSLLYIANNSQLRGDRPLTPGMTLEVPDE